MITETLEISPSGILRGCIEYKGIKFYRYPHSKHSACRRYYTPGEHYKKRGVDWLHRQIWKDAYGEIPKGYQIHHKDRDSLNNDPSNLECLPESEHRRHHAEQMTTEQRDWLRRKFERVRQHAANWHGTEEGRQWHSENGKRAWEGRKAREYQCEYCGKAFTSLKLSNVRFCSPNCRAAQRRRDGKDLAPRPCLVCGGEFVANRYMPTRTCSPRCTKMYRYGHD